jgi:hypothetical protein
MSSTLLRPVPEAEVIAIACDPAGYHLKTEVVGVLGYNNL